MTTRYADDATLAQINKLEAENAALKESAEYAWRNARTIDAARMEVDKKLLAAQHRIKELRETLEMVVCNPSEEAYWLYQLETTLASPDTTEELDALALDAARYYELIMAVESKWPNETRHESALRYIKQREKEYSPVGSMGATP